MKSARLLAIFTTLAAAASLAAISQLELSTLKARASLGDNSARHRLGLIYELEFSSEGKEKMIEYFRAAAESGHPASMSAMAAFQLYGFGSVQKDQSAGLKLLMEAVALKDPDALAELSLSYFNGLHGNAVDEKRGRECLDEACKLGSVRALERRANAYESGGLGYAKDLAASSRDALSRAVRIEETAPDLDSPIIQGFIFEAYRTAKSYRDARKWQDKAIQGGHWTAIVRRAYSHWNGSDGETKDLIQAYAYYNLAASIQPEPYPRASKQMADAREEVAKEMTGAQIAEAQRLSTELNAKIRK
jgi:TPR repeat protein